MEELRLRWNSYPWNLAGEALYESGSRSLCSNDHERDSSGGFFLAGEEVGALSQWLSPIVIRADSKSTIRVLFFRKTATAQLCGAFDSISKRAVRQGSQSTKRRPLVAAEPAAGLGSY